MRDIWFEFNGKNSNTAGVLMVGMPNYSYSTLTGKQITLAGRDGFDFIPDGYGKMTITQDIVVLDKSKVSDVLNWLRGSGKLRYYDDINYVYDAMVITSIRGTSRAKRLDGVKMSVTFTCQPFRQKRTKQIVTATTSGKTFIGQGHVPAMPLVTVEGNGTVILDINGDKMTLNLHAGVPLNIDCDAKIAYTVNQDGTLVFAGRDVAIDDESDWFNLNPTGQNVVSWSTRVNNQTVGSVSSVVIDCRWRWF